MVHKIPYPMVNRVHIKFDGAESRYFAAGGWIVVGDNNNGKFLMYFDNPFKVCSVDHFDA